MKKRSRSLFPIYLRYIFPLVSYIAFAALAFIPCVKFTLDSEQHSTMSLLDLLDNSWESARQYLFSSQITPTNDGTLFYKIIFISIIVAFLLFFIALAADIFSLAVYLIFAKQKDKKDSVCKPRALYLALIPNRAVLCIIRMLALPLLFFPKLVAYLYQKILLYSVSVGAEAMLPAYIAAAIILLSIVITVISKRSEVKNGLNIFAKATPAHLQVSDTYVADDEEDDLKVYHMDKSAEAGSADRIRRLFENDDAEDK